jgi:hypothetical protein
MRKPGDDYPFSEPFDPDNPEHPMVPLDDPEGTSYMGTPIEDIRVGERYAHSSMTDQHYIMTMWEVHDAEKGQFVALEKRNVTEDEAAEWIEEHSTYDDGHEALGGNQPDESQFKVTEELR